MALFVLQPPLGGLFMIKNRFYLLICLKRSDWPEKKVYWMPNQCGYTEDINEAGHYLDTELKNCHGKRGDWIVEPIWAEWSVKARDD